MFINIAKSQPWNPDNSTSYLCKYLTFDFDFRVNAWREQNKMDKRNVKYPKMCLSVFFVISTIESSYVTIGPA